MNISIFLCLFARQLLFLSFTFEILRGKMVRRRPKFPPLRMSYVLVCRYEPALLPPLPHDVVHSVAMFVAV